MKRGSVTGPAEAAFSAGFDFFAAGGHDGGNNAEPRSAMAAGLLPSAAEEAHAADRVPEAMTLVFAGPQRWQNQAYWERYSDHDGLAAIVLAKSGQVAVALERLRSRAELRGVALEVYELLTKPQ